MGSVRPTTPPSGYTTEDINFGRFFKAATQTSKKLLKVVVVLMLYRVRVALVPVWPDTVAEFCFQILFWSKRKFRDNFQLDERSSLDQPIESADYDVSLLTKMIQKFFLDMNLPESFSRAIRDLKNVRNRVCHEHELLDDDQLSHNLEDLKTIFDNLLQETADFFSVEVADMKKLFRDEVDEILNAPLEIDSSLYFEKVEKFKVELVGQFITLGRSEAIDRYAKLKSLHPFTWMTDERFPEMTVDKIFTPLNILENNRVICVNSLLNTESINEETEHPTGIYPSVLVLSGVAGCGKTSLCRYLLHDWRISHGAVDTLRSVDMLIFIELRNVTSSSLVSFLCKALLPETCRQFEEKDVIRTLGEMNVLYIVDGMDEATTEGRQLMNDVFSVLGTSRIIVTTRPEFTFTVAQMAARHHLSHMTLTITGFSAIGMKNYASQVFTALESDKYQRRQQECEFLKFLRTSSEGLGHHLNLPLTLALLICLWKYDRQRIIKVNTATRLYSEIFQLCSTKLATRVQSNSLHHQLELESFTDEWLLALGHEAYEMLEEDEFSLSEDRQRTLLSLCSGRQIDSIQVFSAFLMCEVKESFSGINYQFSFLHKSQMEYLAALYIANKLTMDKNKYTTADILEKMSIFQDGNTGFHVKLRNLSYSSVPIRARKWMNTLTFVIGHLCMKNPQHPVIDEIAKKLFDSHRFNNNPEPLWRLVQESDHHKFICQLVGSSISKNYVWRPETEDLCDGTNPTYQLLCHTSFIPESVIVRIVGNRHCINVVGEDGHVEQRCYENLEPTLYCLSKLPAVHVVLRCDQHYYDWGNPVTTDTLLLKLLPKGNLSALMGHVDVAGAAALSAIHKMGELLLRISEPAALQALATTLNKIKGRVIKLVLRLDLPPSVPPSALPALTHAPELVLLLHHIDDHSAIWAAQVTVALSQTYDEVDLVASSLTLTGAQDFFKHLKTHKITIKDSLTIRSTHHLEESQYQDLGKMLKCPLHWWS